MVKIWIIIFFNKRKYLIKHGETLWNVLGKYQGQEVDIKLNEKGIKQCFPSSNIFEDLRLDLGLSFL